MKELIILAILVVILSVHCSGTKDTGWRDVREAGTPGAPAGQPAAPGGSEGAPGAPAGQPAAPGGSEGAPGAPAGQPAAPGGSEGHPGAPAAHHDVPAVHEHSQGAPGAPGTSGSDCFYDSSSFAMLKLITFPVASLYFYNRML